MYKLNVFLLSLLLSCTRLLGQDEVDRSWRLGLLMGGINYQGDLQPNSFTFSRSHIMGKVHFRKSINNHFSLRLGFGAGKFGAADRNNRDYLQARNLSFRTGLQEVSLDLDYTIFDLYRTRLSPYVYGSIAGFHFNPYTNDSNNEKVFLQPLSTEGQGLPDYADRKPYKLTQLAIGFGGGLRFRASENIIFSVEATQRKTFTDYLDDVSTTYVAQDKLLAARGAKSVELAYRGDELHNGQPYPADGSQRGTAGQKDWYYYAGFGVEVNLDGFSGMFSRNKNGKRDVYNGKCPTVF